MHIVLTRGGFGDIWSFSSRAQAFLHPITQYGDAILGCPGDVIVQYSRVEWPRIARAAGVVLPNTYDRDLRARNFLALDAVKENTAVAVWQGLARRAQPTPSDCVRICEIVSSDRRQHGAGTVSKKTQHAEAAPVQAEDEVEVGAAEAGTPPEVSAGKKPKVPAGPRAPKGTSLDSVIVMSADKEGKLYGPDNNPKRPGTAGHGRFALYKDRMTVAEALAAGIWGADIAWDLNKGFITVEGGTPAATAPTEATEDSAEAVAEAA